MRGVYKLTAEAQIYAYKIVMFKFAMVYSPKDQFDDYMCQCVEGYEGKTCTINTDGCQPNPCLNGGTCGVCLYSVVSLACPCSTFSVRSPLMWAAVASSLCGVTQSCMTVVFTYFGSSTRCGVLKHSCFGSGKTLPAVLVLFRPVAVVSV